VGFSWTGASNARKAGTATLLIYSPLFALPHVLKVPILTEKGERPLKIAFHAQLEPMGKRRD